MILRLVAYLLNGPTDLYLSKGWRASSMAHWEAWTLRQLDTAVITKDVAACRRDAFWKAREQSVQARVLPFGKRA